MAKRNRQITGAKIEEYSKEGRDQGIGKEFLSWLDIQDVLFEGITEQRYLRIAANERSSSTAMSWFSVCGNGIWRTCAVGKVAPEKAIKYVIEIARPDGWSISTLIRTQRDVGKL